MYLWLGLRLFVIVALLLVEWTVSASAQGTTDFDAAMQTVGTEAWGPGARVIITIICAYLFFWGFAHERLWAMACGVIGGIGYWSMGLFLGKVGIAFNTTQPINHAVAAVWPYLVFFGVA